MFSKFFIDRPIFSAVISIVITIAGLVAMTSLPIAQYPNITPPQIQVSTTYPGANAETVSQNVASPIELQVNGADGMLYMYSTNTAGNMTLSIFFDINKNPALAQTDVLNRVNTALPQLPHHIDLGDATFHLEGIVAELLRQGGEFFGQPEHVFVAPLRIGGLYAAQRWGDLSRHHDSIGLERRSRQSHRGGCGEAAGGFS